MRTEYLFAAAASLLAPAAHAENAIRDVDGHMFCSNDDAGVDLRETGDGGYKVDIVVESRGDAANAIYPANGTKLFDGRGELVPYVSINYDFFLDASGNPTGRPAAVRLSLSTGRFAGSRLEPLQSLTLQLGADEFTSSPIGISDSGYTIAIVSGELAPPGSENPYDTEWPPDQFESPIDHFDQSSARWIILSQNGGEVARIPVPQQDLQPVRAKAVSWVQKTTPLLKTGKCS